MKCPRVWSVCLLHYLLRFRLLWVSNTCAVLFPLSFLSEIFETEHHSAIWAQWKWQNYSFLPGNFLLFFVISVMFRVLQAKSNEIYLICKNDIVQVPFHELRFKRIANGLLARLCFCLLWLWWLDLVWLNMMPSEFYLTIKKIIDFLSFNLDLFWHIPM